MYRERASRLDGAVVWARDAAAGNARGKATTHRILPDGCIDLIWHDGERIGVAERPAGVLEGVALTRLADEPPDPAARFVAGRLAAGVDVRTVAAAVGLSERQFRRRCQAMFGYGPKTLARILRLQSALGLCRRSGAATAATLSGYADQAHFARDVKDLTGVPLRALLGQV